MIPSYKKSIKECDKDSDNSGGSPDSELDSGISINGHYDHIDHLRGKNRLDYERIEEIKTMTGKVKQFWLICLTFLLIFRGNDVEPDQQGGTPKERTTTDFGNIEAILPG